MLTLRPEPTGTLLQHSAISGRRVRGVRAATHDGLETDPATGLLTITVHVSLASLESEWRALEQREETSLHQSFDWCAAWAKAHGSKLAIIRGRIDRRTAFLLPLEIVRRGPFRLARFIGSPHSNLNTGLFAADCPPIPNALLVEALVKLHRLADLVVLEKVALDWRGQRSPLADLPTLLNQNASYQLPLLSDFEATLAQVNAKRRRKKFRVSEKRLEALGGYEHVIPETDAGRAALLDLFFEQKAIRFKALGLPNVFKDAATQRFFHELVKKRTEPNSYALQLHAIRLTNAQDGRIVAIAGLSRKGGHVICQFGSIDETLAADASPGELLFYRMIHDLVGTGAALFDFGIGDQQYKRSWCSVTTPQHDIVVPLTVSGRLMAGLHRAKVLAKTAIKGNRRLYAAIQKLRSRGQAEKAPGPGNDDGPES
ncbi:Acetyltransferase involved in cellulose biosynthesis, CelD/BcsL family [Rhizobium sp. RU20A]|uniref:GNAT family N-acetyltransferase n=1 Tax=Rhizobium sp. RU20A TaxID=1907412 RepID=UPI0009546316|nr:GNAT family N-acetyltransferase [Rhizobium sp. RU20A]SIP95827.1 Acetyltransferase involved in cellulose biosynthesis, CelD/BcsL family [Rhizobium sp. RU20A]